MAIVLQGNQILKDMKNEFRNGTLYAWIEKPSDTGIIWLVDHAITYITKSKYTHVAVLLNGYIYEMTLGFNNGHFENGVVKTLLSNHTPPDEIFVPIRDLTEIEIARMIGYAEACLDLHIHYSILKLVILVG